MMVEFCN